MKKLLLILICVIVFSCKTENDVDPSTGSFIRYFGSENKHTAVLALEAGDGYSLLSNVDIQSNLTFTNKIKFIRTDLNGNLLWEKSYPAFESRTNANNLRSSSFLPLVNSGYLIIGDSIKSNGSTALLLLLIDQEGNLQKSNTISLDTLNNKSLHGRAVIEDAEGNLIVLGKIEGDGNNDMYVAKYSAQTLEPIWERRYGAGTSSLINRLYTNSNKNLFWGGSVLTSSTYDVRIVRAPENSQTVIIGNPIGEPGFNEQAFDFCEASGSWAITGSTNNTPNGDDDIYYSKVYNNSQTIFAKSIESEELRGNDKGNSICAATDGGLTILGTVESASNQKDLYLTKFDASGNELWHYNYGGPDDQEGASVRELKDESYLVFGTKTFSGTKKLILMKVNSEGKL